MCGHVFVSMWTTWPSSSSSKVHVLFGQQLAATLARSRSLAIFIEQERREKEQVRGVGVNNKRVSNREVSMSRVFKFKRSKKELEVG